MQLSSKNDLATFWAVLEKIGQLFIPPSGHTVDTPKMLLALADDFFFLKNSFLNGLLLKSRK